MLTSFVDLFRGRQEQAEETIAELVRRVVDGENVPGETLIRAAKESGITPEEMDAMKDRMRGRDRMRHAALDAEAAASEMAKLAEAIAKHEAALVEAQRRYEIAVAPLNDQMLVARSRHTEAMQAEASLLSPQNMEPHIRKRLDAARAEFHNASVALSAIQTEHHEQSKRAEDAAKEMAARNVNRSEVEKLWRDESTRHRVSGADERVFLDWLRGTRRAKEAAEKLPAATAAMEAAKDAVEDIEAEARAS